jgi:hypothetical protein
MRKVFVVLSPRSLPYAELGIASLFKNALEPLDLTLITDSPADKQTLIEAVSQIANPQQQKWQVFDELEAGERATEQFKGLESLQAFRHGHPCWRKLTDPLLFSPPGEEVIILDPDLYFPNRFTFEPTPENTLLLMWQQPNCMFPPESVKRAMQIPVKLAHHVDIGVAHVRAPIDLEWFDWLVKELGGTNLPRSMHIEAIIWSAMAMKMGGGHLNPERWLCWHRTQWKRVQLKLGVAGTQILKQEKLATAKCFHAGGPAKWWLADAYKAGILNQNQELSEPSPTIPFVELTPEMFQAERRFKDTLEGLGYYKLFGAS